MRIWRLHLKPGARQGADPMQFCIHYNILGVGWPVKQNAPLSWDIYWTLGKKKYGDKGWRTALNAVGRRMAAADLCWIRDRNGNYYIGRVEGDWEYRSTNAYRNAGLVNVRPCRWFRTGGEDSVPGQVLSNFRRGATVQQVRDKTAALYARWKYNQLSGSNLHTIARHGVQLDLFSLISPEDCEDIVGIYLQERHGYKLIPSTCKRDTPKTEFVLRKADGKAHVQVRQGRSQVLDTEDFRDSDPSDPCKWFLFTTSGKYTGGKYEHVHCLDPVEMRDFALSNLNLMSSRVQAFVEFLRTMRRIP